MKLQWQVIAKWREECAMNLAALSPTVREAAERFERETGRRLDDNFPPGSVDEAMIGVFLIVNGYPPKETPGSHSGDLTAK
jgi:hypothetical protein